MRKLSDLKIGEKAVVTVVNGEGAVRRRLFDMGITPGAEVYLRKKAPLGDPIEIAFNAKYITDVIRNVTDNELCMKFNTNVSPCVFTPVEGDGFLYLILPVRVFQ